MNFERNINYYELDGMNVVHHSNYIRYMEEARIYLLDKIGLPYKDIIVINVNISEFDGIKLKMKYEITNKETGKLLGTGETKHCFTNSNMRPVSLKKANQEFYNVFEEAMNNE